MVGTKTAKARSQSNRRKRYLFATRLRRRLPSAFLFDAIRFRDSANVAIAVNKFVSWEALLRLLSLAIAAVQGS